MKLKNHDLEVDVRSEQTKAVIEGRTSVPFKTFVQLILQRKVTALFKDWGTEPVIISSELLTTLASAPQDNQEDRSKIVLVTLGVGVVTGILVMATGQLVLLSGNIALSVRDLSLITGGIIALAFLSMLLMRTQKIKRGQKVVETMEKMAAMLGK